MTKNMRTIIDTNGRFTLRENGIIYFYKADDIVLDKPAAFKFLENIGELDNSGNAQLIVIQGHCVEYTFDAQRILFTNALFKKVALVTNSEAQYLVGVLLQDMARVFKARHELHVFDCLDDAEKWMLSHEDTAVSHPIDLAWLPVMSGS